MIFVVKFTHYFSSLRNIPVALLFWVFLCFKGVMLGKDHFSLLCLFYRPFIHSTWVVFPMSVYLEAYSLTVTPGRSLHAVETPETEEGIVTLGPHANCALLGFYCQVAFFHFKSCSSCLCSWTIWTCGDWFGTWINIPNRERESNMLQVRMYNVYFLISSWNWKAELPFWRVMFSCWNWY